MGLPDESQPDCVCEAGRSPKRRKAWDITELLIGYGLVFTVLWTPRPYQRWLWFLALAWFIVSITLSFDGWKTFGCCKAGFWRCSWVIAVALLMAAVATAIAVSFHTLHHPDNPIRWLTAFGGYTVWAFAQQMLLQGYFLARLLRLVPNATLAAFLSACIFALAHVPNPVLTPLTLVWGLAACLIFVRARNIYPLAIAHAIFGICIAITVPATLLHNMRVGLGYIQYHPRTLHLSHNDHVVSTKVWVSADAPTRR